jgi:predicted dehydrogenase
MIQEFVNAIEQNRKPSVTWNDGYEALRVALAAYRSAATKAPVKLNR